MTPKCNSLKYFGEFFGLIWDHFMFFFQPYQPKNCYLQIFVSTEKNQSEKLGNVEKKL